MSSHMESARSFTEVSYHSSDDEIEVTSSHEVGEDMVYEEVEVDEDESFREEEGDVVEQLNDVGDTSVPVKANAPLPLHQLLAKKLKNTNVKLVEPGDRKPRSVKEMAAAFSPPRPSSFTRRPPIETGRVKGTSVWPTTQQFNKSPEHQSFEKPGTQAAQTNPTSKPPARKEPIFKLSAPKTRPVSTKRPAVKRRSQINRNKANKLREVDRMEILNEGSNDSNGSSSASSDRQSSSTSDRNNSESQTSSSNEDNLKQTRTFDGSVSGSSSSSSSSSNSSFSVSSGTDESLAAKLGDLGTPFAPLPIAANFIPEETNHDDSGSSSSTTPEGTRSTSSQDEEPTSRRGSFELQGQVSWSDLLGEDSKNELIPNTRNSPRIESAVGENEDEGSGGGDDDESDSDSYESYETASSEEEFETDTERDNSKSVGPPGVSPGQLLEDQESAETSDYETDTTYERKYAASEGRTPPPPKNRTVPFLQRPIYSPMPVLNENDTKEEWSNENELNSGVPEGQRRRRPPPLKSNSYYEKRSRRRKPFEDIPTAVAAELRNISKNDPAMSCDGGTLLGITGWDGQGEPNNGAGGNCFDQIFKKKGDGEVSNTVYDPDSLPPLPLPPSPPSFDPPDYDNDDDEISNITDRVFSPKKSKPEQPLDLIQEDEESETQTSQDASSRFSITSFRKSNSVRNTERALEGLKATSIEPNGMRGPKNESRNIPALLNMQNETVDFFVPREYDSRANSVRDYPNISPSSSRAFDSREIETQRMEGEYNNEYDPYTTEIVEEVFVGYDDDDRASHSRFEFNDEEDAQDGFQNPENGGNNANAMIGNVDEKSTNRKSKRLRLITCIVICNFILLLGIGAWFLVEYFFLEERNGSNIDPGQGQGQGIPALPPPTAGETAEDIEAELAKILKPDLPDGGKSFDQKTSPQSEALNWLSNDPKVHTYDKEKISIRFALATFYYATGGDSWTTNHLWLSDLDECLWYTSSSDFPCTDSRYSRLVLNDNNLEGNIPDELSLLSNSLVDLNLDGTFTGEIPSNVGDLARLTTLRLSGRVLSGKIPSSLYTLSNLSILDLGQNILSGEFSGAIRTMSSSLSSLSLMNNHFTGSVPREIGQLTGLTYFNIDDNYFESVSQEDLGRLTKLETLSMRNNALKGRLPSNIGSSLTNLKGLFLNNNRFTGSIPDSYGNLSKLETGLDLSSNRLTGRVPESLGELSMLKNLLIRDNGLSGTIPLSWGKLSILNTLRLDSTNFEGELPTELCNNFNEAYSSFYVDCWNLHCPCCNFCCDGKTGECICRFADSIPILCVEP